MKVLVTGHEGYIGAHLVPLLKAAGHHVIGCDVGLFSGCEWDEVTAPDEAIKKDYRMLTERELEGVDCIMHLAALSNDPMGEINPQLTYDINRDGSIELARKARAAGVPRYLFSSSCSIYGRGAKLDLDEDAALNPVSAYAESKVQTEQEVALLADDNFSPAFLRNATAYGDSPMLRIDLVVNNLLACAHALGDIRMMSDGTPWRPLIHCHDIARAFVAFLNADRKVIHNQAVNIGGNDENYQVRDVADKVKELLPQTNIVFTGEVGSDPRNYRVDFSRLRRLLPDFRLAYDLARGMRELHEAYGRRGFSREDFEGPRYTRLRTLKERLNLLGSESTL